MDYDYVRNDLPLSSPDELALKFDGVVIDHVAWTAGFGANGESATLSVNHFDHVNNDDTSNLWCDSTSAWPDSDGDFGSPGFADTDCAQ